jgi:hypothetical protein
MKHRKEFEALFLQGREGQLLAQSQLDTGADGLYFNPVTRAAYEWFERGAEQLHGDPVAWQVTWPDGSCELYAHEAGAKASMAPYRPLYTHADPGKVEQLQQEIETLRSQLGAEISKASGLRTLADGANKWRQRAIDSQLAARDLTDANNNLHTQLAERNGLLRDIKRCGIDAVTICGPNIRERDERADYEHWLNEHVANHVYQGQVLRRDTLEDASEEAAWDAWQARAALERKP